MRKQEVPVEKSRIYSIFLLSFGFGLNPGTQAGPVSSGHNIPRHMCDPYSKGQGKEPSGLMLGFLG